ncbi:hypothetical protein, variant [Aphanomyces astaci]|uniref:Striatin N-terminal domain-containing protein n=1 Tax=Aphanomyces astaci TaxID=112090 RepID=W4GJW2_APHAT|nr:hypothetical protein, variant [Aphanomyces astaci]ETV79314.1 hypothetical protein, variant [Aphanomyces astaci]|eukprot:XP_009831155.1 hypothetical protein, variant [Aphanomyces astaci]
MESVEDALKYLAKQFESANVARVQWQDEKKQFQAQLHELEAQKKIQDDYAKELVLQVKMLEYALQQERGRYMAIIPAPKDKATNRVERANTSPFNSPRNAGGGGGGGGKEQTVFRKGSSNLSSSSSNASLKHSETKGESEVSRGGGGRNEISRNDVSVTRSKEGETFISRPRVNSKADKILPPPSVAAPVKGPPPVEVTTKVNGSFRACKMKLKLSGHLDGVRAICFHPTDPLLVSGSEDCTVKIWNLASKNTEVEPVATLRLHTESVLAVAAIKPEHSSGLGFRNGLVATGSKDGTIGLIAFPEITDKPVEPLAYDEYYKFLVHRMEAHRDAIWGLYAHPYTNLLFSASADACVRVWGISAEPTLKCTLGASVRQHPSGLGHNIDGVLVPTCVSAVPTNAATVIAGYTSCTIGQYDISSERLIQLMVPSETDVRITAFREAQVNCMVSHPTMPLVVAAHQDRRIRFYDLRAGQCVASVVAHQDAVSSLALDASGLYVASGGHDGSLRFWSVAERTCVHEQSAHRPKYAEAVHSVAHHATRGFVATGGADSVIKVFQ